MNCKICSSPMSHFAQAILRGTHNVAFYQCKACGFVQTEEPYWLSEAYISAINRSDVGLVRRNITLSKLTAVVISTWFDRSGKFIDFGGGYGLFVRLMRDRGYDFFRSDAHCENLFARGFDAKAAEKRPYELLTAFEVFEHLAEPLIEIEKMLHYSSNILFATELLPFPVPRPEAWSYYGLDHGQHISFYTRASLQSIADQFHLRLYTNGRSLHLLTTRKIKPAFFTLLSRYKVASLIDVLLPQRSLQAADYKTITGKDLL
jgi:hypothetical protein